MYIVRMYSKEEMAKGFLSCNGEFGVRSEAAEFDSEEEAQEAIDEFLDEYSEYRDIYSYKIKSV